MSLFGYLANVLVGQVINMATSSPTYTAGFNPLFAGQIDALRIVGASVGETSLLLDNFVFSETSETNVPPPAGAALLPLALAGLAFVRRQRA